MNKIPYIITTDANNRPSSVTAYINGKPLTVQSGHVNFLIIIKKLLDDSANTDEIYNLINSTRPDIPEYSKNKICIINDKFYFNGEEVKCSLVDKIKNFMRIGLEFKYLLKFLENLMSNPCPQSRLDVYEFLENESLPITDDGCFIAYKGVKSDFYSINSGDLIPTSGIVNKGSILNAINSRIAVNRSEVVLNKNEHCAQGLHAGSYAYAEKYAQSASGIVIAVKINPRDVVSVPTDTKEKVRVCEYYVLAQVVDYKPMTNSFQKVTKFYNKRDGKGRFTK